MGELARAIFAYRESVRLNPALFEGYVRLADELYDIGSVDERHVATASYDQVRQPIYKKSRER